ncbi:MAG: AbrB/MazE/SpoVT family DNA-binding domain-containing protein [Nanoarchaeota archaeon]
MIDVTKISSKGQIVIPSDIRKELGLDTGSKLVVSTIDDFILLKKVTIPDPKDEFLKLTAWGRVHAKKKAWKPEDVERMVHESRGVK